MRPPTPASEHAGYHYQPAEESAPDADPSPLRWRMPALFGDEACSHHDCDRPAVAVLMRRNRLGSWRRQRCCAEHAYGRWVEGGKVWHWRLVPDADREETG